MKWLSSKYRAGLFVAIAGIFGMSCPITGQEKTDTVSLIPSYQKRIQQYQTRWDRLVPYEISTCDMLLISRATNRYLKPKDYLSLSFGLKIQFL